MKIGIIGAGATGLAAADFLVKQGHEVTVLERNKELGGLAASIDVGGTRLERYYHHIFASDTHMIDMIKNLGLENKLHFRSLPTGIFYKGKLYDFGTPLEMLSFPPVPLFDRLRFAASSAYLKVFNSWRSLEKRNALDWCRKYAGRRATEVIWEPLLRGKFGDKADDISMAWLWARIHSRTFQLGYLEGGFDQVYVKLADRITTNGGQILFEQQIDKISQPKASDPVEIFTADGKSHKFDKVITTTPQPEFARAIGADPADPLWQARYLGATCFIIELKKSLIPYYWLNINDTSFPFLAVVEHTQMEDKKQYGGNHVLYVGNYVPREDWRFNEDPEKLLEKYLPFLNRVNPDFKKDWIVNWQFSKAAFAQPIVTPEYRQLIPPHDTVLPGVKLATMAQVYPYDRGQNYAIKMGLEVARSLVA